MKSKGIFGLSRILVDQYDGQVPADFEALEALPAVGHKTASVVMTRGLVFLPFRSIPYSSARLPLGLEQWKNVGKREKDLKRLIPESKWNKVTANHLLRTGLRA